MNFCHIAASWLLTYTSIVFFKLHYGSISRGVKRGKGGAIPRAPNHSGGTEILRERQMIVGAPKSPNNVTSISSIQYICFRKNSGSNMGALNLLLAPGTIYPRFARINQEISSIEKLIHSLLCCKTTMQTNCGLTNCTGNSPETGFLLSVWRLVKSWVSHKFYILHSYIYCCFSFSFQGGHQALKK